MKTLSRSEICTATAEALHQNAPRLSSLSATLGLDGFVDEICDLVEQRTDHTQYTPQPTIAHFAQKVAAAAGKSANFELVVKHEKLGGNGPIMANALAAAGMAVHYIGALGHPSIHPVFADMAKRSTVYSLCDPGHTDAVEFSDGKLMLGKITPVYAVTWENLIARVGLEKLTALLSASVLIGFVNWTMLPMMSDIWSKLAANILPKLPPTSARASGRRLFFVDLADPEKRSRADLLSALKQLTGMQSAVDVVLGLNLKEALQVEEVLGLPGNGNAEGAERRIESLATSIRAALNVHCVVVHPRRGAAAATANSSAEFQGPFVSDPKISTGAGDHFNAGFCLGLSLGLSLECALCIGVGTSGYYVRTAESPSAAQLAEFIQNLPEPQ